MRKTSSTSLLLVFVLVSSFFTNKIIAEITINEVGRGSILLLIFAYLLVPFIMFILKPLYEKIRRKQLNHMTIVEKSTPFYLIIRILASLYLIFTLIITMYFTTNKLNAYYFNSLPLAIYFIILLILIIYSVYKGRNSLIYISSIVVFVVMIFYIYYILNPSHIDFSNLNKLKIATGNNLYTLLIFILPILLEPFLFILYCDDGDTPYKKRYLFFLPLIASLLASYAILRQGWEFGILLNYLNSPFIESTLYVRMGKYAENIALITILYYIGLYFLRILFTLFLFTKIWNIEGVFISIMLVIISSLATYLFLFNISVFNDIMMSIFIISVFILLVYSVSISILVIKGGGKDVKSV